MFSFFKKKTLKKPVKLPVSTDIHCHIIPGVDDGSPDLATSLELIERMRGLGFERIFASPHVTDCTFENTEETLATPLSELNEALQKDGFSIERHAEYRVDDFFAKQMHEGKLKVLPNNYILIEHSFLQEPFDIEGTVYELKRRGFNPILAHPERYKYYYGNKERYRQLHDLGLYFQVNLLSLADHYKGEAKAVAEWLIDQNLVEFIGTDIHRHEHIDAIEHYLMTPDAEKHFKALQGKLLNDTL